MANDDLSSTMSKNPISRKYRILTDHQLSGKSLIDDLYANVVPPVGNSPTPGLPSLLSKSTIFPSSPETMHFKKYRSKQKGGLTKSSSFKIERQTTNIISQTRLPILCTTSIDNDQKRKFEFQRRQIYALNHFMRDLEQEKFRQFCELNDNVPVNPEEIVPNGEDSNH